MPQKDHRAVDSQLPELTEGSAALDDSEIVHLSAVRARAADEAAAAIARQLNGPVTALMLYMTEIKQHSGSQTPGKRPHLQPGGGKRVRQTERAYAFGEELSGQH